MSTVKSSISGFLLCFSAQFCKNFLISALCFLCTITRVDEPAPLLALDIRGHGISRLDFDPGQREYMWEGIEGPAKDYVYVGAYMDCIRGLDFLASRPEVDASRLVVEGGSQWAG